jgi:nickel-dependent lactate racemase
MELKLAFGSGERMIRVPPEVQVDFLRPADPPPLDDVESAFINACRQPLQHAALEEGLNDESRVVILVADLTRSKGTEVLLPACVKYVQDAGVAAASITVVVARGTHRKLTKEEKDFFKSAALAGVRVVEHNCDDADKLSALLLTRRGTPVRVNNAVKTATTIILLSPISFHYFAGFGGGRKLVLPGCADRAAILANHRLSLVDGDPVTLNPRCRAGVIERNPVHEDMCEPIEALKGVFGINFFSDNAGDVVFVNAGDPIKAHEAACEEYRRAHEVHLTEPLSVLIMSAGGSPYDINFLQSHKALRHAAGAMKRGGTVLYLANCEEGVGSASLEAALKMKKKEFLATAYKNYDLNNQTAVSFHDLTSTFDVGMVSAMNVDILLGCGIKPCVNVEAFLAEALEKHQTNRIAVIPHGSSLLPVYDPGGTR